MRFIDNFVRVLLVQISDKFRLTMFGSKICQLSSIFTAVWHSHIVQICVSSKREKESDRERDRERIPVYEYIYIYGKILYVIPCRTATLHFTYFRHTFNIAKLTYVASSWRQSGRKTDTFCFIVFYYCRLIL